MAPTKYRGRVEISCLLSTCKEDRTRTDIKRECLNCEHSFARLIDLEERPIGEIKKKARAKKDKL